MTSQNQSPLRLMVSSSACLDGEVQLGLMIGLTIAEFLFCVAPSVDDTYLAGQTRRSLCCAKTDRQIVYGTAC
jgi:hypothetical protein